VVELQAVTVAFGPRLALRELTLTVAPGGSLALWGPNGAGKSTTFHAMLGLVPYQGQIRIGGLDAAREGAAARRLIGWAPQDLAPADLSVARTVSFMADVREAKVASVAEFLAPFGLEGATGQTVAALSGGQRKRLSVALALLGNPQVLLLDEPTAGLDPQGREEMLAILQGLRRQGKTLLMATHRISDVFRLADDVALMADGSLQRLVGAARMARRRVRASIKGGRRCAGV
jgi:ABC-type multidrug transport system ATPase subunit